MFKQKPLANIFLTLSLGLFIITGAISYIPSAKANNRVFINVGKAKIKKSIIAITPIQYYGNSASRDNIKVGHNLFSVVKNDMQVSSLFKVMNPNAYLEDPAKVGLKPNTVIRNGFNYKSWQSIGTDFLVRAGYRINGSKVKLETYVYYVPQAKLVFSRIYEGSKNSTNFMAHKFSNDIVKALTGKKGMFNSKIVAARKGGTKSFKEIYIMDWDGSNKQAITAHKSIALSPTWSPDGKRIAYTAYAYHKKNKTRNADIFIYELRTKKRWLVAYNRGTNAGASFFPNSKEFVYYHSKDGRADLYRSNNSGKVTAKLTNGPNGAANIEPAVSPDGRRVAFVSDRSGRPMIYVMNVNGTGIKRLTFAGKYNANPSWSPDGKKIAFAGHDKGRFDLFTINADGTNLKRLTSVKRRNGRWANNEYPSWSPDGRHLVFVSNRSEKNQIYIINEDGTDERRITFDNYNYHQPQWSPSFD